MSYLKSLALAVIAVFMPIQPMLVAAFALASVDLVLGILSAKNQKQAITSQGLKRTVAKIFLYELAILMSYVAEHYLLNGLMPVTKLVAGFIGAVELKSILENLDILNGSPIFAAAINKLSDAENHKSEPVAAPKPKSKPKKRTR
jgi:hypothetical protein